MKSEMMNNEKDDSTFRNIASYDTDNESINSEDELLGSSESENNDIKSNHGSANVAILGKDSTASVSSLNAPDDRYNMIYIIFFIQGVGMLLPWNFFITAKSYFDYKFKGNVDIDNKFENAFALSSMFPNVISLFLNIFLTGKLSRGLRIITCLVVMFSMFILTTILVKIDSQEWTNAFFAATIVSVVIINLSAGVYQGTIFGVAGIMGSKYMQAIMSGQALAGIFAAVADLISKLVDSSGTHPTLSAFVYFLTAAVVIAITAFAYSVLAKLPRMQFYFQRAKSSNEKRNVVVKKEQYTEVPYWLILRQILRLSLSVALVFSVTLSMFPAVLSKIESVHKGNGSRWNNDLFPTLMCFLIFNCGDWCGRIVAGHFQIVSGNSIWLPVLCVSRVIFIPLFLLCNMKNSYLPSLLKHDAYPVVLNVLFSVSNGYLGSLCMMFGPRLVKIEYAETAGTIMSLFLTIGLSIGACISFVF